MGWQGRERRAWPRIAASFSLRLAVEVGLSGSTATQGMTVNISRGGILATVAQRLPLRGHCSIRFLDAGERIEPTETSGRVVRLTQRRSGYLVGIAFDKPLDVLRVERTLWKKPRIFDRGTDG